MPWFLLGIPRTPSVEETRERFEPKDMPRAAPTLLGLLFTTALVFGLVLRPEEASLGSDGVDLMSEAMDRTFKVADTVVGEALPNSIPDAVAVAFCEGFACVLLPPDQTS